MTPRRRLIITAVITAVVVVGASAAAGLWLRHELNTPFYNAPASEVFVDIPRGASSSTIAGLLSNAGVIRSRAPFVLYIRWSNLARRMKAGEYRFASRATPVEIAARIAAGDVYYVSITIPEGLTARETIELLTRNSVGNLDEMKQALRRTDWIKDLDPAATDLEGFLFPDTYRFLRKMTTDDIVRTMVDEFRTRFGLLIARFPVPAGWNAGEIVTLASMIEKEVKAPEERPLVASVLMNRLRTGMPLDCDSTVIFALKISRGYDGSLHRTDLAVESPYNSYLHKGLPPGPIASPGEASLAAALSPAHTDYFYYVSRNDGTHQFSRDYKAHLLAVARYQKPLARHPKPGRTR